MKPFRSKAMQCTADDCGSAICAKGLCNKHYLRARKAGTLAVGARSARALDLLTYARQVLCYCPETGRFTWSKDWYSAKAGSAAGNIGLGGYMVIGLQCRDVYAHRLAWAFVHGSMPRQTIDHINGIRSDNRLVNLRDVSLKVNCQNSPKARRLRAALGISM